MPDKDIYNVSYTKAAIFLAALLIIIGLFIRVYDPDLDPPDTIGTNSQALVTDPANVIYFAANNAKFGDSEPFPYPRWRVFKISLVSGTAYLLFALFGLSAATINLAGVIPSFLGILLFAAGFLYDKGRKAERLPAEFLIVLAILALNFTLMTYNRAPFLESGLLFYLGLIFFLYQRFLLHPANIAALAVLTALACITGKIFAIVMAPVIIGTIIASEENKQAKVKKTGLFLAASILASAGIILILFGSDYGSYFKYLGGHIGNTESGFNFHWSVFYVFLMRFMTLGTYSNIFRDSPFLFTAVLIVIMTSIAVFRCSYRDFLANKSRVFIILWLGLLYCLFAQAKYAPLRYQILLFMPLAGLIANLFSIGELKKEYPLPKIWRLISATLAFFIGWYALFVILTESFDIFAIKTEYWIILILALAATVIAMLIITLTKIARRINDFQPAIRRIVVILIVLSCAFQLTAFVRWTTTGTYNLKNATVDIGEILSPQAVLTGSYSSPLVIRGDMKNFIYFFGLGYPDRDIFADFGITHLAVEDKELNMAIEKFPETSFTTTLSQYAARGHYLRLLRIIPPDGGYLPGYNPTAYELANDALDSGFYKEAEILNETFLQKFPKCRSGLIQRILIREKTDSLSGPRELLDEIKDAYPDDPIVRIFYRQTMNRINQLPATHPD